MMKNLVAVVAVGVVGFVLCSCATMPAVEPSVARLALLLGPQWQGDKTEDAIFLMGTNVLRQLWAIGCTDGYPDEVYHRAEYLSDRFDYTGGLRLVHEDHIFSGTLPVSHQNLAGAVRLTVPLLVPRGHEDKWTEEATLISPDGTRAQVRCSVTFDPLSGSGWLLLFVKRDETWTLVRIERTWVS